MDEHIRAAAYIDYNATTDQIAPQSKVTGQDLEYLDHRYQVGEIAVTEVMGWGPYNYRAFRAVNADRQYGAVDDYLVELR